MTSEDNFEHRARGGVNANTFKVTAVRYYKAMEPTGKDYEGKDYYHEAYEYETDEHPDWVFGWGGEETSFAYEKSDPKGTLDYSYGWSNWGPYWHPDPYVYEKFPVLWKDNGEPEWQKDTWSDVFDGTGLTDEANYYSIDESLLHPEAEDIKILIEKIGRPMDDETTWEHDDD